MEKESFRILVDFSDMKDRLHKFIWMLISTYDLKSVGDLKLAIVRKFNIDDNDFNLFVNGGLLLEEENVVVLRENDVVQIKYEKSAVLNHTPTCMEIDSNDLIGAVNAQKYDRNEVMKKPKKHKRKSQKVDLDEANDNSDKSIRNHITNEDLSLNKEENNLNKGLDKHKRKKDASNALKHNGSEICVKVEISPENNEEIFCPKKKYRSNDKGNQSEREDPYANVTVEENAIEGVTDKSNPHASSDISGDISVKQESEIFGIQGSNCKKRKRKRHRKRKVEPILIGPLLAENANTFQNLAINNVKEVSPCDNYGNLRKHVRYSPSPEKDTDFKQNGTNSLKETALPTRQMYVDQARKIVDKFFSNSYVLLDEDSSQEAEKLLFTKSHTGSNSVNISAKLMSMAGYQSSRTILNSTEQDVSFASQMSIENDSWQASPIKLENEKELPSKQEFHHKEHSNSIRSNTNQTIYPATYDEYPSLTVLPEIGSLIAFKLLELNESYSPEVSKYKLGVIKSINSKSEELEIELTEAEIKSGRTGKFENLKEDETPSEEVIKTVIVPWCSLIEPRLISSGCL